MAFFGDSGSNSNSQQQTLNFHCIDLHRTKPFTFDYVWRGCEAVFYMAVKETSENTPSETHDEESSVLKFFSNGVATPDQGTSHGARGKIKLRMMNNRTLQDAQVVTRQKHLLGLQWKYASSLRIS